MDMDTDTDMDTDMDTNIVYTKIYLLHIEFR